MGNKRGERYDRLQANDGHDAVIHPGQIPSAWVVASRVDLQEGFRFRMSMAGALETGADSLGDTAKPRTMEPKDPLIPGRREPERWRSWADQRPLLRPGRSCLMFALLHDG